MIRNVHQRPLTATVSEVGALMDTLGSANDRVWPTDSWPPMKLQQGLAPGSSGGHGPIRYSVEAYEPGRSVTFRFAHGMGINGTHTFEVKPEADNRVTVRHEIVGSSEGAMKIVWPLAIRWQHDALIEDAFDNIETTLADQPPKPRKYSFWVRQLRRAFGPGPAGNSPTIRTVGDITAVGLAAAAAIHAAWGLGMKWPGTDSVSLARMVTGGSTFPSAADCFTVTAILTIATALVAARTHPDSRLGKLIPAPFPGLGVAVVGTALGLRAAVGWVGSSANLSASTPEFRRLDLRLFSPICTAFALGAFAVNGVRKV